MDLSQLANLGEFIGGVAVLVTLAYLAVQIRGQAQESRHATVAALTLQWNDWFASVSENPELAELYIRGLENYEAFEAREVAQWGALIGRFMRVVESLYLQKLDGRYDARIWPALHCVVDDLLKYRGTQVWWERRKHWYSHEFVALVDEWLADIRAQAPETLTKAYPSTNP